MDHAYREAYAISPRGKDEAGGGVLGHGEHRRDRPGWHTSRNIVEWRKEGLVLSLAWKEEQPFTLAQLDVKDVLDKGTLVLDQVSADWEK